MEGDAESVLTATDQACHAAVQALEAHPRRASSPSTASPAAACSATTGSPKRSSASAPPAAAVPVAGFYTYGEIARTRGISGFHNQTLVVLALA